MAMPDRPECGGEADRDGDRPRKRERLRRLRDAAPEQRDRGDARGRCEQRVLECAQTEHAHACLAVGDAGLTERVQVDREPALRHEGAETGGDRGESVARRHVGAALDAGDLAVAEHVPDIRDDLGAQRDEEPDRLHVPEPGGDVPEAGRPRDSGERCERDRRAPGHEHERLCACPLHLGSPCELPDTQTLSLSRTPE